MSILKIYHGQALQMTLDEIIFPVEVRYLAVAQPEPDTLAALADLMTLTPHLSVATYKQQVGEADQVVVRSERGPELIFVGAPLGTELASLVSAIVVAGRGDSGLSRQTKQALADLSEPVYVEVFTTPI
jgi:alkyl hydroperoxide reductase subunit AhpF